MELRGAKNDMTMEYTADVVRSADPEGTAAVSRLLLSEHRLEVFVNERLFARLVCTPQDLERLVMGRLITERVITSAEEVGRLYLCESGNRARVFLREDVTFEEAEAEEPTCCTDNHVYLKRREDQILPRKSVPALWRKEWIFALARAFAEDLSLHRSTGGTHSCLLAVEGKVLYAAEDLGRHNAMDKAVGYAAMEGIDRSRCILFTTGRVPTDMVKKAVAAGIPTLVSKAVPTAEAVEMAKEQGLSLLCRAWPDSFEVYAGENFAGQPKDPNGNIS